MRSSGKGEYLGKYHRLKKTLIAITPMLLASLPTAVHTPLKIVSIVLSNQQCLNLQTHITEY